MFILFCLTEMLGLVDIALLNETLGCQERFIQHRLGMKHEGVTCLSFCRS